MNRQQKKRIRKFIVLGQATAGVLLLVIAVLIYMNIMRITSDNVQDKTPNNNQNMNQGANADDGDSEDSEDSEPEPSRGELPEAVETFASRHNLSARDYPESILELLDRNPEAKDFVLNYPLEYGKKHSVDMSEFEDMDTVPLFLQWDKRWGYLDYGSDVVGITGCGPVTLAMAGYYLTGSEEFRPDRVVQFALDNGYCIPGSGSSWTLMSEGAKKLGLDAVEIPLDKNRMEANLKVGNLIVCAMGPGDFTTSGHYILLTGMKDGKFRVNDVNSPKNSQKLWSYEEIEGQIKNLWVLRTR